MTTGLSAFQARVISRFGTWFGLVEEKVIKLELYQWELKIKKTPLLDQLIKIASPPKQYPEWVN